MTTLQNNIITVISMSMYNIIMFILCTYKQKITRMAIVEVVGVAIPFVIVVLGRTRFASISTYVVAVASYIIFWIYLNNFSNQNKMITFSLPALGLLILYFTQFINYNIIYLLSDMDIGVSYETFTGTIIIISGTMLVTLIIVFLIRFVFKRINLVDIHLSTRNTAILTGLIITTLCASYSTAYVLKTTLNIATDQRILINNVSLLPFTMIIVSLYLFMLVVLSKEILVQRKEQEIILKERMYESLTAYNISLEGLYSEMKAYQHDTRNIMSAMSGYIESENIEKLKEFFYEKVLVSGQELNSSIFKIGRLQHLKIGELKGVIAMKAIATSESGIDFQIEIAEPITAINMDMLDLCRIVGVFLDNAIEEASSSRSKQVRCSIIKGECSVQIVITNSLAGDINLRKLFEKGYTTKGEGRGLGLYNVNKILEKYPNTMLDTKVSGNELIILLDIESK